MRQYLARDTGENWEKGNYICIKDLEVECIIGIYPHERETPQKLYFDVELEADILACARSDEIDATIDYDHVADLIARECIEGKYQLVETCVAVIRTKIKERWPGVRSVNLMAKKPAAIPKARYIAIALSDQNTD